MAPVPLRGAANREAPVRRAVLLMGPTGAGKSDLAVRLAVGQQADPLNRAFQRQAVGDAGPELAFAMPAQQLRDRAFELARCVPAEIAQRRA